MMCEHLENDAGITRTEPGLTSVIIYPFFYRVEYIVSLQTHFFKQ